MSEMSEWRKVRLGDITTKIGSGSTPRGGGSCYKTVGISLIRSQNVLNLSFSANGLVFIDDEQACKLNNVIVNSGDVLLNITGDSVARSCMVPENHLPARVNQHVAIIRANSDCLSNVFLLYYLQYIKPYLLSISGIGGTRNALTKKMIEDLEINCPSLSVQQNIADILGSLDDKIELNSRINSNLESQAQALFKRWFVDFEFPDANGNPYKSSGGEFIDSELGGIPKGWKDGYFGTYCKVKSGFAFKSSWWEDKGVKVLKIKNIQSNNTLDLNDCSFVSEDKVVYADNFKVVAGDLLIAMTGATIGKFTIVPRTKDILLVNQRVGKFFLGDTPTDKLPFIYNVLKQDAVIAEIINRGQGSAQPNISPSDIETINVTIPDTIKVDAYNIIAKPLFDAIINNNDENQKLINLRNTLLPKLMNNEIKV